MVNSTQYNIAQAHDEYMAEKKEKKVARGKYIAAQTSGLAKYVGNGVSSTIKAVGPKTSVFTAFGYLAGGPFGAAAALGLAKEGKNLAREAKNAGVAYIDAGAKAEAYKETINQMNQAREKYGLSPQQVTFKKGFYATLDQARKYEMITEAVKKSKAKDLGEFLDKSVAEEKRAELEGRLRDVYNASNGNLSSDDTRNAVSQALMEYQVFIGGTNGLVKHVSAQIDGIEKAKAKQKMVDERKRYYNQINNATNVADIEKIMQGYELGGGEDKAIINYANKEIKKQNAYDFYISAGHYFDNGNLDTAAKKAKKAIQLFNSLSLTEAIMGVEDLQDEINQKRREQNQKRN